MAHMSFLSHQRQPGPCSTSHSSSSSRPLVRSRVPGLQATLSWHRRSNEVAHQHPQPLGHGAWVRPQASSAARVSTQPDEPSWTQQQQEQSDQAPNGVHSSTDGDAQAASSVPVATPETSTEQQAAGKGANLANRILYGSILGFGGGAVVLYGQWPFLAVLVLIAYQATREYFTFITSKGISKGMTPPPPTVTTLTTVLCVSIAISAGILKGRSGMVLAVSAFALLVLNVITVRKPRFAQLASTVFGVFYCGWLPSFWIKLRNISTPLPDVPIVASLQGFIPWNVGLLATLTAVACVIAADTGAYFVGKNLGRTKLTDISPKKTVEGALGGLVSSVAVALMSNYATQWPGTWLAAAGFGVIVFFASLFGDLIESIMKREAEMKDSGDLIPGHGGLLDRFDSYMFTGAVVYAYVLYVLGAVL